MLLLACALCWPATAAVAASTVNTHDKEFVTANAQTNLAELSTAKIALSRSHSPAVRALARMITTDHTTAQHELLAAAQSARIALPTKPSPRQLEQAAHLQAVAAAQFDVTYLRMQINGHQASIQNTRAEIGGGVNTAVVSDAKAYLPVAQKHLRTARTALDSVSSHDVAAESAAATVHAFGHERSPSNDTGWLIGLAVVAALVLGAGFLVVKHSVGSND